MTLTLVGIDPDTDRDHCPAVLVENETGDLLFVGPTVADSEALAQVAGHTKIADHESVVRLPALVAFLNDELAGVNSGCGLRRSWVVKTQVNWRGSAFTR